MDNTYRLEIITPEKVFFQDEVISCIFPSEDGFMSIQKNHEPLVAAVIIGPIKIHLKDDTWVECATTEGFMEVRPNETMIFAQTVEWPDEIDMHRAQEAAERARERLRQKQSWNEYQQSHIALARAMVRLKVGRKNRNME